MTGIVRARCRLEFKQEAVWPITTQCRVLAVSASGYHQHRARSEAPDHPGRIRDMALLVHIRTVFAEMEPSGKSLKRAFFWKFSCYIND